MASTQTDIMDDQVETNDLSEHLDDYDVATDKWPDAVITLQGTTQRVLEEHNIDAAPSVALELTMAICQDMGGIQQYIPKADTVKRFFRDREIWQAFTGNNVAKLAKQYDLTEVRIYDIVRKQRAIEKKRRQGDLFGDNA